MRLFVNNEVTVSLTSALDILSTISSLSEQHKSPTHINLVFRVWKGPNHLSRGVNRDNKLIRVSALIAFNRLKS